MRKSPREKEDDGFTLIELIISSAIGLLVLVMVGTLLIQSIRVQTRVQTTTQSTSAGQLVVASISKGVRTSTSISSLTTAAGTLLTTTTLDSTGAVSCSYSGWYYSTASGSIYSKKSAAPITAPAITSSTPSPGAAVVYSLPGWTLLTSGVNAVSGSIFVASGLQATLLFKLKTISSSPVLISTSVYSQGTTLGSSQCP